jgi:hypothetical protein
MGVVGVLVWDCKSKCWDGNIFGIIIFDIWIFETYHGM